ncbi:hypothetical protein RchiOBHm_Chr1g0343831 [Rosa chinensis]|uniref:Uncharacterized protein n=1 Tax=Rosa chinensis TaxID=74649 RepID=A0A2P6SEE1_ROSCH|nr:hypothetical protein RchiOBHm_Chr1g0343831 [Rosa chinensis]
MMPLSRTTSCASRPSSMAESLVCSLPLSSNPSIRSSAEKAGSEEHGDKETKAV